MKKIYMNLIVIILSLLLISCQNNNQIQAIPIDKLYYDTILDNDNNFDSDYIILNDMTDYQNYKLVVERFNRVYDESFFTSNQVVFIKIKNPGVKKYVELQLRDLVIFNQALMVTYVTPACYLAILPDPMILLLELDKNTYDSTIKSVKLNGGSDYLSRYENKNNYIEVSLMKYSNQASIKLSIEGVDHRIIADYNETRELSDDYDFSNFHSDTLSVNDLDIKDNMLTLNGVSYIGVNLLYEGGCIL